MTTTQISQNNLQHHSKGFIICINHPKIFKDDSKNITVIYLKSEEKEGYLNNKLIETLDSLPDGVNVIIYIKMHGAQRQNKFLYHINSTNNFKIDTEEIISGVEFGRGVKAMNICGILQICYGTNYTTLLNCFDMCISTHRITRTPPMCFINDLVQIMNDIDIDTFYETFEDKIFPMVSEDNSKPLWAIGEIEKDEICWELTTNLNNIYIAAFMRIWKEVLPDENYTREKQLEIRIILEQNGYNLNILINKLIICKETTLESILQDLKIDCKETTLESILQDLKIL